MKEYFHSDAKFLKLDITFPYEEMLKEAKALRHRFVSHRASENHKGWKSLTIHGLGEDKTGIWKDYGYKNSLEASNDMRWTDAAYECPITMDFLLNGFPCKKYGRVRFMLLEAGGYIGYHSDGKTRLLENINIVLNNPIGCIWKWQDESPDLFMEPGGVYAMGISHYHSVINDSDEDRYHMIISRHDATPEWKQLMDSAAAKSNVTGYYEFINELP
jgi:Aspartyl/Asparaginyl beta-hydroxylase